MRTHYGYVNRYATTGTASSGAGMASAALGVAALLCVFAPTLGSEMFTHHDGHYPFSWFTRS